MGLVVGHWPAFCPPESGYGLRVKRFAFGELEVALGCRA